LPLEALPDRAILPAGCRRRTGLAVDKVTWQQVGRVTEPGRYLFKFGWLTITAEDVVVWKQFPNAAFTLVRKPPATAPSDAGQSDTDETNNELHLGAFELQENSAIAEE
jgi:hypothetical protein